MVSRTPQKKQSATIFDVAKTAGVSIKTVSRVVNNEANVREKTRDKVQQAIQKLDYRPSAAARGLSGKRSYVIGFAYETPHEFSYVGEVLNGALDACARLGYSLLLKPLTAVPYDKIVDEVRNFVVQTRVDGMILPAPICDHDGIMALMKELDLPCARLGAKQEVAGTLSLFCNDEEASCAVTEFVISQGHKNIGFIKGHPDHGASEKRYQGYRKALKKHRIRFVPGLVKQGYFDFESGKDAARELLNLKERPTAIISSNDDMAAGVLFEAHEYHIRVPEQLSVVGFDDTAVASHIWPPLTTVRQPSAEMSNTATALLIQKIQNTEASQGEVAPFTCQLVVRSSTTSV